MRGIVIRPQHVAEGIAGAIPRCPQELSHFSLVIPVANQRNLTTILEAKAHHIQGFSRGVLAASTAFASVDIPAGTAQVNVSILDSSGNVVDKINAGVRKALEDPAVRKRIEDTGSLIVANTPEQFAEQIKAEFTVYKQVVDNAKLTLD